MNTPIFDFVQKYQKTIRFHMPGHKGQNFLGMESLDITEVKGADSLYEADDIIAHSEANATKLFGSFHTYYSCEGSSQCIKAMLYLVTQMKPGKVILAARNVHKAFVYGAALCDMKVEWLFSKSSSLCSCPIDAIQLEQELIKRNGKIGAFYITSPDYLGNIANIKELANVCHKHDCLLVVDNAHGAYLNFLEENLHPIHLGADLCCDSAHKTLPVLTGGAYLHLGNRMKEMEPYVKHALCLFGSTSPSYLILQSLDLCNAYLEDAFPKDLATIIQVISRIKSILVQNGWKILPSDPLRISIQATQKQSGFDLANLLRTHNMECEYADANTLVLMLTPQNKVEDLYRLVEVLGMNRNKAKEEKILPLGQWEQVCSIREAIFSKNEILDIHDSLGRICASPVVSCPPAIPVVVSGERIHQEAIHIMEHYGIDTVCVIQE
ncbi:MAG: aminotransferase class V-fold PLP-dependent enzyme [Bacillota bacterium]|nr:aminotransferase class V-fold PLP-dependent enzyme [Bacillota bacterium]